MKRNKFAVSIILVLCFIFFAAGAGVQGNVFTYQGRLMDEGAAADGEYDIWFRLLDGPDPDSDSAVTEELIFYEESVDDGYFTVELDFVPFGDYTEDDIFDGSDRWLWIGVRAGELADPNVYTYLSPLTKVATAPYAHLAHQVEVPVELRDELSGPVLTIGNEGDGVEVQIEGNGKVRYIEDAVVDILNDYFLSVGDSQLWTVGYDLTEEIGHNRNTTIALNETKIVGVDSDVTIIGGRSSSVGGADETSIGGNAVTIIGGVRNMTVGGTNSVSAGNDSIMNAGGDILLNADGVVQMQSEVAISNDANDLLRVDGVISLEPMGASVPFTAGYGKIFVNGADDKLYFMDVNGVLHDLSAFSAERVSFSVKRNVSYNWPTSSTFEAVDLVNDVTIWDNTGSGFDYKNGVFIAPADGLYSFNGVIFFTSLGKGDLIAAAVNAAGKRYRGDMTGVVGSEESVRVNVTVYLEEGQTAVLEGYVSAAVPPVSVYGATSSTEAFTYFNGARVD